MLRAKIKIAGNHKNIFNDAKVPWSEYRYYDPKTIGLDFDGMLSDIKVMTIQLYVLFFEMPNVNLSFVSCFWKKNGALTTVFVVADLSLLISFHAITVCIMIIFY